MPIVYDELRRLAAAKLAHESPGQTLQATAYLRLMASNSSDQVQLITAVISSRPRH